MEDIVGEEAGDVLEDVFEEAGDALSASEDVVADAADEAAEEVEDASRDLGDAFSKNLFKKRPKTGNNLCSWSWKERRCEPAAICKYQYQASCALPCGLPVVVLVVDDVVVDVGVSAVLVVVNALAVAVAGGHDGVTGVA